MEVINPSKVPVGRKRGATQQAPQPASQHSFEPMKLERVFGSGSCGAPAIACPHPVIPGLLAYSCGAVVVLYDSQHKQQTTFFCPKPRRTLATGKPYSCLAFSRDGAYLAAGERSSQSPEILVWEVSSNRCLQALRGHKHGVGSIAFSSDGRLLVSTGESYDGQLCVWDWQAGVLVARQHTQAEVQRACFTEDLGTGAAGLTITTVGKAGHFKVWSLTLPAGRNRDGILAAGQASLTPRPASLKEYRSSHFVAVAVAPPEGSVAQALLYALTQNGVLLTLRPATRTIDKSLSLQVPAAFALAVSSGLIACACSAGVVRLFATRTLAFRGNLPRPSTGRSTGGGHPDAGSHGGGPGPGSGTLGADPGQASAGALFPDAVGCAFDAAGERLTVVYTDRSLMVWDVRNPARVTRMRSVLSHAGVVWSAALIPPWQAVLLGGQPTSAPSLATPGGAAASANDSVAPSSVLCTCGADGTVRLWNVCLNNSASTAGPFGVPADMAAAAKVTRTLRAIIYANPPATSDTGGGGGGASANQRYAPEAPLPAPGGAGGQAAKPVALRCLRVSPCGRHLATGDARGNLRIFSLATLQQVMFKEAHDAEILSLDYSPPSLDGACYLASGSRDMFVHVYDMSRGYELVGTCDAHSGAVTAVRFSACGSRLALLSCSADKSIAFRLVQLGTCGLSFELYHIERMSRGVLYDMAVDPAGGRAVAVGQDNQLRLFDVATGRAIKNFSGDSACGEAVSVAMDPSGHLAICSCADGSVAVYDVDAGQLLARGSGHSEVCTGAVLLEDHRGLVSVGGDGCALLWRLSPRLAQRMQDAAAECRRQLEHQAAAQQAMEKQRRQAQEEHRAAAQEEVTPAMRRRKAWDLSGAAGERVPAADATQPEGAEAAAYAPDGDDIDEPQQVHVDMSATLRRVRDGKPLLSLEKLPRWAQRTAAPHSGYYVDTTDREGPVIIDTDTIAPAAPAGAGVPPLAGVWAQRAAMPPPPPAVEADLEALLPPPPPAATAIPPAPVSHELPGAFSAAAAAAGTLTAQQRTWAELVEEDDEIVFCDPLEDGPLLLGDALADNPMVEHEVQEIEQPGVAAPPFEPMGSVAALAAAGAEFPSASTAAAELSHGGAADSTHNPEQGDAAAAVAQLEARPAAPRRSADETIASPQSPAVPSRTGDGAELEEGPASGCASNRVGEPPVEKEATAGESDAIRRDLFREHFDSLGLDQASATKAPPPDPRRMSFTLMYRQARASSGAGSGADGAATPLRAALGVGIRTSAAGAGPTIPAVPGAPGELPITPFSSRLPLPPGINVMRGSTAFADVDGAVTSAAWTPEPAMLPLTSPVLQKTEKQLQELERIRLRLLSTLRKRQTNEEAALRAAGDANTVALTVEGPAAEITGRGGAAPASATGVGALPCTAPAPAGGTNVAAPTAPSGQTRPDPSAHVQCGQAQQPNQQQLQPTDTEPAAVPTGAAAAGTDSQQTRDPSQSAGGFLLPPPPAYTPVGPPQRPSAGEVAGLVPESPPVATQPSPGFSSLSTGTPMLGKSAGAGPAAETEGQGVFPGGDDAGSRLFVFNPIYGASPATPIFGPGAPAGAHNRHRPVSPRGTGSLRPLSIAGDAGPTSSPAEESESVPPTPDDVIRAVLESDGGGAAAAVAAAADDGGGVGGGVCVITTDGPGSANGKEQRRQAAAAATEPAPSAAAVTEAVPSPRELGASPAKGSLQRPRLALPAMKPKLGSPDKPLGSARGLSSMQAVRAAALAAQQPSASTPSASAVNGDGSTDADAALLERMQSAVREFAGAYRRLITAAPSPSSAASPRGGGAAGLFQAAARSVMAQMAELLQAQEAACTQARKQEPQPAGRQDVQANPVNATEDLPPVVMCPSPLVSQEMQFMGRRQPAGSSRFGWMGQAGGVGAASVSASMAASGVSPSTAAAAAAAAASSCRASQVVVEVGMVESMVEEKLQQRMQEEMRKVEESVMQRIMQTMMARQQQ